MFVMQKHDAPINWPVVVEVPVDGGKTNRQEFTAQFQMLDQEAIDALAAQGDTAFIRGVLVGWGEDVKDPDGKAIKFGKKPLAEMTRRPYIRKALIRAYYEMAGGVVRKN
ncbi:hypothetical protein FHP88_15755 [Sedimenticola selenatireducens]|uniref:Uncharacterized protein n=1 Tax=Sedimenticola selenatireducens TaxID=191960 RepID=A0A557S0N2_9GAMM|nr:hypothetical protein [Sedimenticola selenatireducens]TVO70908.1 hypothetical protein FHP88_15755 [Sedimenticola selenatireducens]